MTTPREDGRKLIKIIVMNIYMCILWRLRQGRVSYCQNTLTTPRGDGKAGYEHL